MPADLATIGPARPQCAVDANWQSLMRLAAHANGRGKGIPGDAHHMPRSTITGEENKRARRILPKRLLLNLSFS